MKSEFKKPLVFEYQDYKKYLREQFQSESHARSGQQTAFSKAIGCQPAYLSRVLNGDAHLSPEQADKASHFLGHSPREERYFFFLVLGNRAGTQSLKSRIAGELKAMKEESSQLKSRVPLFQPLSLEGQTTYYSAWYYATIHMLFDIKETWTPNRIAETLGLSLKRVQEVLSFLTQNGLLNLTSKGYEIQERETHVDADSPLVAKHHINWRMKAIQNLERNDRDSLHYSSVVTVSRKQIPKIREILVSAIADIRKTVRDTEPEDTLYSYSLDLFPVTDKLR
jgi:uncharacterized protein (TIGR02147 family)